MVATLLQRIPAINLEELPDVKNIETGKSYFDDYSDYSFVDNGKKPQSTNLGRNKSANISSSQDGRESGRKFMFLKNKTQSEVVPDSRRQHELENKQNIETSIPIASSTQSFNKNKMSLFSQADENPEDPKKYDSSALGVINEVNEKEFDSIRNEQSQFSGANQSLKVETQPRKEEPNFI